MEIETRKRPVSITVAPRHSFDKNFIPRRFSVPVKTTGIEYNRNISLDQVIESLKRAKKQIRLSSDVKISAFTPFSDEFFESIEMFLDKHQMFIVSPTNIRSPKLLKQYLKMKSRNCPSGGVSPRIQSLGNLESQTYDSAKDTALPSLDLTCENSYSHVISNMSMTSLESKKGPCLGGVSTSALLSRRKKFGTMDKLEC